MSKRNAVKWVSLTLAVEIGVAVVGVLGVVAAAEQRIARGAPWNGIAFDDGYHEGPALVFECDPASGVSRGYYYLWPWGRVAVEKRPTGN